MASGASLRPRGRSRTNHFPGGALPRRTLSYLIYDIRHDDPYLVISILLFISCITFEIAIRPFSVMSDTKCQHVVPKFHLRHFSNGDVIFTVNIHDGNQSKQNISDACAWNFIYDDDPQSIGSMEKILCKDEKELSIIIDNIVKNNNDVADPVNLIRFVSHLSSRSLNTIESAQWMKNHNAAIDTKEIIKKLYTYQYEILSTEKSSEYDAFILINNSDIDFITADIPFYFQDVRGSEEQDREKIGDDLFNPDYVVCFCPISLNQCIVT